jgi:hypothetical protein
MEDPFQAEAQRAQQWLREQLAQGPRKAGAVRTHAEMAGFRMQTLEDAKRAVGIEEFVQDGKRLWRLPSERP